MECREPLSLTLPSSSTNTTGATQSSSPATRHGLNNVTNSALSSRYQRHAAPAQPPANKKPPETVPLPIPRNVLMISLLEAAERQEKLFGEALFVDESMETSMLSTDADVVTSASQDEDEEMERILLGIEAMTGPCGTYVVKDPDGLDVLPFDPRRHKEDLDLEGTNSIDLPDQEEAFDASLPIQEPFTIRHRQTVQVIGASDGVFKLARSAGYIVANENQLVKVGTPLEKSCQLEGMKHLVDLRKQDLHQQLDELQGKFDRIMRLSVGLQIRTKEVLSTEPDHPVISEAPDDESDKSTANRSNEIATPDASNSPKVMQSPARDFIVASTSHEVEVTESPVVEHYALRTPNTIDNSELDREFAEDTTNFSNAILPLELVTCGSGFFGPTHVETSGSFDSIIDAPAVRPRLSPPPLPTSMSPNASASIDFSTGLSGHRGLTKTRSGRNGGNTAPARQIRMMGAHRGLGTVRPRQRLPVHPQPSQSAAFPLSGIFNRSPQRQIGNGGQHLPSCQPSER